MLKSIYTNIYHSPIYIFIESRHIWLFKKVIALVFYKSVITEQFGNKLGNSYAGQYGGKFLRAYFNP